jgi:ribosome-binding protein aMBF1 (putative translation factor)
MEHQNWDQVVLNNAPSVATDKAKQKEPDENVVLQAPPKLGHLISKARVVKDLKQKEFAAQLGISQQVLSRWETNKEIPSNADIAKMERILGITLPRVKKIKVTD